MIKGFANLAELENQDILLSILRSQLVIMRAVKASSAKEKLTLQQFGVLRFLAQKGAHPMNAISEELKVSPPDITGIVDRLEAKGLLKRVASIDDRRRTDIVLTVKGKRTHQKIREDYSLSLQDSLAKALTPAEQETLAKLLEKLTKEIYV